eukprot:CAMPEP_0171796000 /NCGR_PEP_ID=MMETSP0991-20121206/69059_1 /TAXON_ID=483369 /ORGANISM="non described non described, Strain CCMP2098" /LENGTH=124 /DNA_ID=CAMNT_0012406707 /DNA_START=65 /DNA_END=435 /DNA_ORIENTATION=-
MADYFSADLMEDFFEIFDDMSQDDVAPTTDVALVERVSFDSFVNISMDEVELRTVVAKPNVRLAGQSARIVRYEECEQSLIEELHSERKRRVRLSYLHDNESATRVINCFRLIQYMMMFRRAKT